MFNWKTPLLLALSFTLMPLQGFANEDPVVATVNGQQILKSQLDQAYRENMMFVSSDIVTRERVLNDLIHRKLGIAKAKSNNLDQDPIVKSKMEDILYHAQISKDLEGELKKIEVTEQDVRNYYREHPEYRTAHILFRVQANPEQEEWEAALKKALEVYNVLKTQPEKFSELANRYSQSSTAPAGGDMGFQPAARLAPEYFQAIKGKSAEHITPPVRTQFGYHIIRVLAVKEFDAINMPLYQKLVYDQKRDAILANYFRQLRQNANIQINEQHL